MGRRTQDAKKESEQAVMAPEAFAERAIMSLKVELLLVE